MMQGSLARFANRLRPSGVGHRRSRPSSIPLCLPGPSPIPIPKNPSPQCRHRHFSSPARSHLGSRASPPPPILAPLLPIDLPPCRCAGPDGPRSSLLAQRSSCTSHLRSSSPPPHRSRGAGAGDADGMRGDGGVRAGLAGSGMQDIEDENCCRVLEIITSGI
ncbi:hypothetical protein DAI22_01g259900 [Oryza sativa Japonica Group]|nr:hypothetical protein DAI22_01g259900 [Oryza sativa Japonica Group]